MVLILFSIFFFLPSSTIKHILLLWKKCSAWSILYVQVKVCFVIANETTPHQIRNGIGVNGTATHNEQNPYPIIRFKRPQNDKCYRIQTRNITAEFLIKIMKEKRHIIYPNKRNHYKLQTPDFAQPHSDHT